MRPAQAIGHESPSVVIDGPVASRTSGVTVSQPPSGELSVLPGVDVFVRAGVSRHHAEKLVTGELSPAEVASLWNQLAAQPPSLAPFGPRMVASMVLAAAASGADATAIHEILDRSRSLVLVRPDGYLVHAYSGQALERAGSIEPGRFYHISQGVLREVGADLGPDHWRGPIGELSLGQDPLNQVINGAEDAFLEVARGIAAVLRDPDAALDSLANLPANLRALIRAAPNLIEQFRAMPESDQIRAVSELFFSAMMAEAAIAGTGSAIAAGGRSATQLAMGVNGAEASLAFTVRLDLVAAGGAALAGGPGTIAIGATAAQLVQEARAVAELGDVARAGMKQLERKIGARVVKDVRLQLTEVLKLRLKTLEALDGLLARPLPQNLRGRIEGARNAIVNSMKDADLVGALRDKLDIPVRTPGDGRVFDHHQEVMQVTRSLEQLQNSLAAELRAAVGTGPSVTQLSETMTLIRALCEKTLELVK